MVSWTNFTLGFVFFLQASHCHVVFELFGILFSPKQPKWIKCPFPQPVLWHSSSLSVSVAWVLQMQMVLHSMAAWVTADAGLPFVDFLLGLNWGSLQQCEQYQVFSVELSVRAFYITAWYHMITVLAFTKANTFLIGNASRHITPPCEPSPQDFWENANSPKFLKFWQDSLWML